MPEGRQITYTSWEDMTGSLDKCYKCSKHGNNSYGVMVRRRVTGRDGDEHTEYKIVCRTCGRSTKIHRGITLTRMEWTALQEPGDGLKHRNRKPEEV